MSKTKTLIVLSLIVVVLLLPAFSYASDQISDWAIEEVEDAMSNNLAKPELFSNYKKNITREEFAELTVKTYEALTGVKAEVPENKFADTNNPEILKATKLGLVNGVSNDRFNPEGNLTREEMSVMLNNLTQVLGKDLPDMQIITTFSDTQDISHWALESVKDMYKAGILNGVGNDKIDPKGNLSREQALVVMSRFYNVILELDKEIQIEDLENIFDDLSNFEHDLTDDEKELARLVNEYRLSLGLKELTVSKSLTKVARIHTIDTEKNKPYEELDTRGIKGNLHSWSGNGPWKKVIYTSDHKYSSGMWNKPSELTNYKGSGFEISAIMYGGTMTPERALGLWQNSEGHNNVIIGKGSWSDLTTMGIGIRNGVSHIWFGKSADPDGYFNIK